TLEVANGRAAFHGAIQRRGPVCARGSGDWDRLDGAVARSVVIAYNHTPTPGEARRARREDGRSIGTSAKRRHRHAGNWRAGALRQVLRILLKVGPWRNPTRKRPCSPDQSGHRSDTDNGCQILIQPIPLHSTTLLDRRKVRTDFLARGA